MVAVYDGKKTSINDTDWSIGRLYGPERGMEIILKTTEIRKNEIEVVGSKFIFRQTYRWEE